MHIGNPEWSNEYWSHLTDRPKDRRYSELAERIVSELPIEYQDNLRLRLLPMLRIWMNKPDMMSERHETASDPTGEFFGPHAQFTGYCVHTSHAAAFLVGIRFLPCWCRVCDPAEQQKGSAIWFSQTTRTFTELYVGKSWVGPSALETHHKRSWMNGDGPDMEILDALEELARAEPDSQFRRAVNWRALGNQYSGVLLNGVAFVLFSIAGCLPSMRRRITYRKNPTPYWVYVSALDALSEQGWTRSKRRKSRTVCASNTGRVPEFYPHCMGASGASVWRRTDGWFRTASASRTFVQRNY